MGGKFIFTNVLGGFVFDNNFHLVERGLEKELLKKYKNAERPEKEKQIKKVLEFFRDKKYFNEFHEKNLNITKKAVKESVTDDLLVIQAIDSIDEIDKVVNILVKRLREWYSLYNPEVSYVLEDHHNFVETILKKDKKRILKEFKVENAMGADLSEKDVNSIIELAEKVNGLYKFRKQIENYIEKLVKKLCPNITEVAGSIIAARLLEHAGSLRKLAIFPASTIQLLGAEKALFRHMRFGAKAPKYGVIFAHPLIQQNKKKIHGKIARTLADKISLAARVDYFKGNFIGDKLKKGIEEKFNNR